MFVTRKNTVTSVSKFSKVERSSAWECWPGRRRCIRLQPSAVREEMRRDVCIRHRLWTKKIKYGIIGIGQRAVLDENRLDFKLLGSRLRIVSHESFFQTSEKNTLRSSVRTLPILLRCKETKKEKRARSPTHRHYSLLSHVSYLLNGEKDSETRIGHWSLRQRFVHLFLFFSLCLAFSKNHCSVFLHLGFSFYSVSVSRYLSTSGYESAKLHLQDKADAVWPVASGKRERPLTMRFLSGKRKTVGVVFQRRSSQATETVARE